MTKKQRARLRKHRPRQESVAELLRRGDRSRRRGIVLLVVLSLLSLFVLVGVTYAVVAGQYRRAARAVQRYKQLDDDPRDYLDRAMYQLVRDTNTQTSRLLGHSLLRDLYGNDGVVARVDEGLFVDPMGVPSRRWPVTGEPTPATGQLLRFRFTDIRAQPFNRRLIPRDDYYNGCVLTFLSGDAAGHSTRIVDYYFNRGGDNGWGVGGTDDDGDMQTDEAAGEAGRGDDQLWIVVERIESDASVVVGPKNGDVFLINGRPFNGTGVGFERNAGDPRQSNLTALDLPDANGAQAPLALLPNFGAYESRLAANLGGSDESYDAVDFQNMFLAMVPPNLLTTDPTTAGRISKIIPSLHRPALVNYWRNTGRWNDGTVGTSKALRRKVMMRPMPWDHPDFTGSNPLMELIRSLRGRWDDSTSLGSSLDTDLTTVVAGVSAKIPWQIPDGSGGFRTEVFSRWDVDNDGDGVPDSVWIDCGFAVKTSPDGRQYKPMIAILCKDMDGRLDVNAAGNLAHTSRPLVPNGSGAAPDPTYPAPYGAFDTASMSPSFEYFLAGQTAAFAGGATATTTVTRPRGLGVGPAEINLAPVFGGAATTWPELDRVLRARYGADGRPGRPFVDDPISFIKTRGIRTVWSQGRDGGWGNAGNDDNGIGGMDDIGEAGWPGSDDIAVSYYGSPPDTQGIGAFGLNLMGHPLYPFMGRVQDAVDDPYEFQLASNRLGDVGVFDTPYTDADMERLLRWHDSDAATIPSRLLAAAPNTFHGISPENIRRRNLITTRSSHIPMPNFQVPTEFRQMYTWSRGPDGAWGKWAVDDEGDMTPDNPTEAGYPGSDDSLQAVTVLDLLARKLIGNYPDGNWPRLPTKTNNQVPARLVDANTKIMMPFELLNGKPMDINRALGNGRDDNGNGIVDEPIEQLQQLLGVRVPGEVVWNTTLTSHTAVGLDYTNGSPLLTEPRQQYARHLYCLMMLMVDQGYTHPLSAAEDGVLALNQRERRELTAQRIAQWAINVVDFRDSDSVMTPFEYDVNPFNGWDVDGWVGWHPGADGNWGIAGMDDDGDGVTDNYREAGTMGSDDRYDGAGAETRLVWGCEKPELLITETKALHDRGVKDHTRVNTARGRRLRGDMPTDDPTLDQFRLPEGSLFVELYCPRSPVKNRAGANAAFPFDLYAAAGSDEPRLNLAFVHPQPSQFDGLQHPLWRIAISEMHNQGGDPRALANRPSQRITQRPTTTTYQPTNRDPRVPARYRSSMSSLRGRRGRAQQLDIERVIWFAGRPRMGMTPGFGPTTQPLAQATFYNRRGWNVSLEPGQYLMIGPRQRTVLGGLNDMLGGGTPSQQQMVLGAGAPGFAYQNLTGMADSGHKRIVGMVAEADPPRDPADPTQTLWMNPQPVGVNVTEPLPQSGRYYPEPTFVDGIGRRFYDDPDPMAATQLFLDQPLDSDPGTLRPLRQHQMLATESYEDARSLFLQRLADPTQPWHPELNPYITVDWASTDVTVYNGYDREPATWAGMNPWDPDDPMPQAPRFYTRQRGSANPGTSNLWFPLTQLRPPVRSTAAGTNAYFDFNLVQSFGYLNPMLSGRRGPGEYFEDPINPFPWLQWNNRPYANPYEVMNVPAEPANRLLSEFRMRNNPTGGIYDPNGQDGANFRGAYRHLLNFFHHSQGGDPGANFHRILEYIETPSPYVGTETLYNANAFNGFTNFRPPYSQFSRFRDPGRVNINTIFDDRIWEGVAKAFPAMDPRAGGATLTSNLFLSRQGYGGGILTLNSSFPTMFANPFRSAASANLAPLANMRQSEVDATLLRRLPGTQQPLFDFTSTNAYENTNRNPTFRYQGVQRLSNLLTTHSNVYSVWVTVGFFEVQANPNGPDEAHPDGFRLGQELGLDSGKVKRHRAFYMIDRSIPVAFQPGENHNVDRAVLIRRFIE